MDGLERRIVGVLYRGPMLLSEITQLVGGRPKEVRKVLNELVKAGRIHRRRSGRFWIYWLDGRDGIDPADWELIEGLTVFQVLEEAARLA